MTSTQVRVQSQASAPTGGAVAAVGTGGTFAAATYFWKLTRRTVFGESPGSTEVTVAIALNGSANLTWTLPPAGTVGIRIYRGTVTNTENVLVGEVAGNVTAFTDTGGSLQAGTPPAAPSAFANATFDAAARTAKSTTALSGLAPGQLHQALRAINLWHNFPTDPAFTGQASKMLAAVGLAIQEV
jgi:hypothetical protein